MLRSMFSAMGRAALVAALLAATATAPAWAASASRSQAATDHLFECLGFLLFDADAHRADCLPDDMAPFNGLSETGRSSALRVLPPPVRYIVVTVSDKAATAD